MSQSGTPNAESTADGLSYLFRNHLPFLMYLQPIELNNLLQTGRQARTALQDDAIWNEVLRLNQRLKGIRLFSTCVSLSYAPNEILSVDAAFLPDRRCWRLCRMLCPQGSASSSGDRWRAEDNTRTF